MENIDFNKLWQNFVDTVTNHFMDFNGRVGRAQFWWYMAVVFVVSFVAGIVGSVIPLVSSVVSLALILPNLGMIARRLQDTGKPGNWALLLAIPIVLSFVLSFLAAFGAIFFFLYFLFALAGIISLLSLVAVVVMIYFCIQPGQTEANQYGPVPPAWTPNK